jgi:signal transduction histidine kinase
MSRREELRRALETLRRDRESLPWVERRVLAAGLADVLSDGQHSRLALDLLSALADDSKPEVRKEVADLLLLLPEEHFTRLAARLSEDTSSFVRKAVERALDRRRKGTREMQRRRETLTQDQSDLTAFERAHGKVAAERARKLADRRFDHVIGAIAHDVRGILSPLKASVSQLMGHAARGTIDPKLFRETLARASERLAHLDRFVDDMRAYSRSTPMELRRERIADVIHDALGVARESLEARGADLTGVTVSVDAPGNLTAVMARHQIVAAFAHIARNGFEALLGVEKDGKRMDILARAVGQDLQVTFRNNGPHIDAEDLQVFREFIPGRTTKKNDGTGFGLPTAYRYAANHGGGLTLDSVDGEGVTVTVTLPMEHGDEDA